jgi:hypothetical protein
MHFGNSFTYPMVIQPVNMVSPGQPISWSVAGPHKAHERISLQESLVDRFRRNAGDSGREYACDDVHIRRFPKVVGAVSM